MIRNPAPSRAPPRPEAEARQHPTPPMSHRILLVDDEVDILEFVGYNLLKEGYELYTARDGAEALQTAARCQIGRASCRERV